MKFTFRQTITDLIFRVEIAPQENPRAQAYSEFDFRRHSWEVVDTDKSLQKLLERHQMLSFTDQEITYAESCVRDMDDRTLKYCFDQAKKIDKFADESLYRIATCIYNPALLVNESTYGLSQKVRRLTLATALELGVTTF